MSATLYTLPAASTASIAPIIGTGRHVEAVSRCHVHRAGTGEPLVLLHGLGESTSGGAR